MNTAVSRKMLRTMEPYHGMIYFVPEAADAYQRIGLTGRRMGYFASRAAAMGPVPADVVIATFFNFSPALVRRVIPAAWERAGPQPILDARRDAADGALRRMLGAMVDSAEMKEASSSARSGRGLRSGRTPALCRARVVAVAGRATPRPLARANAAT